jgi:hypothetical protein
LAAEGELLRTGIRALAGVATVGGLAALVDRSLSAADCHRREPCLLFRVRRQLKRPCGRPARPRIPSQAKRYFL